MKKHLEPGNNNHLLSLLMLSDDKLSGISYLNGKVFKVKTRGRNGNLLQYYNYIIGNTKRLSSYLDKWRKDNNLIFGLTISEMYFDDKHGDYQAIVRVIHDGELTINDFINDKNNWCIDFMSGNPTWISFESYQFSFNTENYKP